jgi:hypothetical protein
MGNPHKIICISTYVGFQLQRRQLSKFLMRQLQTFSVCTLGHTTHIHTVIKLIPDLV